MQQPVEGLSNRMSLYNKLLPADFALPTHRLNRQPSSATITRSRSGSVARTQPKDVGLSFGSATPARPASPTVQRRVSHAPAPAKDTHRSQQPSTSTAGGYTPLLDSAVTNAMRDPSLPALQLPPALTADDFTRAVAVATVSALRHQQHQESLKPQGAVGHVEGGGHGGHDAPSWSRLVSASVLLACTVLYAVIAGSSLSFCFTSPIYQADLFFCIEILVDVVDVVLEGSGIDEKFLGVTLFALVPNTTEFMNAISFALNDNIALSMEIGSAYALQVCLLQIPAMVAFSAWHSPSLGSIADAFT